jgi:hypothetical protein
MGAHAEEVGCQVREVGELDSFVRIASGAVLDCHERWSRTLLQPDVRPITTTRRRAPAGAVAGIGGCAIPAQVSWWNLYYGLNSVAIIPLTDGGHTFSCS